MKPLDHSGALVDFKERIIFEKEKDLVLESSEKFYKKLRDIYKYNPDVRNLSNLYRKIINYQINKYGATLSDSDCNYGNHTREEQQRVNRRLLQRIRYRKNK